MVAQSFSGASRAPMPKGLPACKDETRGDPTDAKPPKQSLETHVASRLWDLSEKLTGVKFGEQKALPATLSLDAPAVNREV
jgi:hypothetical protein